MGGTSKNISQQREIPTLRSVTCGYLKSRYGNQRHASKIVGSLADVSHRTSEKWLRHEACPEGDALLRLIARCDGLAEELIAAAARLRELYNDQ